MKAQLRIGETAPNFFVRDIDNKQIHLSSNKKRYTLIVFLRYAGCPWCNLAIHRLVLEYKLLQDMKCDVIAFVQSSETNIIKNIIKRHKVKPLFPIIPDPKLHHTHEYGASSSVMHTFTMIKNIPYWVHAVRKGGFKNKNIDGNLFFAPALFLISPKNRKIVYASYSPNLYVHETFTEIYECISTDTVVG